VKRSRPKVIKTVIRCYNDMVIVFDKKGEQIPEYQGQYPKVRESILRDAPHDAVFGRFPDCESELEVIPQQEW
jgi:hypothetical protein